MRWYVKKKPESFIGLKLVCLRISNTDEINLEIFSDNNPQKGVADFLERAYLFISFSYILVRFGILVVIFPSTKEALTLQPKQNEKGA